MSMFSPIFLTITTLLLCVNTTLTAKTSAKKYTLPTRSVSSTKKVAPTRSLDQNALEGNIVASTSNALFTQLTSILNTANNHAGGIADIINGLNTAITDNSVTMSAKVITDLLTLPIPSQWGKQYLLHIAALYCYNNSDDQTPALNIVTALLGNGQQTTASYNIAKAALTKTNALGSTPMHYAAMTDIIDFEGILSSFLGICLSGGVESILTTQNIWGYTPVHYAAAANSENLMLIQTSVNDSKKFLTLLNKANSTDKATPMHYLAATDNANIINATNLTMLSATKELAQLLEKAIITQDANKNNCLDYALVNCSAASDRASNDLELHSSFFHLVHLL